jgi:hypothetical protein
MFTLNKGGAMIKEATMTIREAEHSKMKQRAEEFLKFAEGLYVDNLNQADELQARNQQTYAQMKAFKEYIEEDIKNAKVPYQKLLDKKKGIVGPLDEGTKLINNKVGEFRQRHNAIIEAKMLENEAEALAEQEKTGELVIPNVVTEDRAKGSNGVLKLVLDIVDFDKVPHELCKPTSETAKEVMRKTVEQKARANGLEEIPGCSITFIPQFRRKGN